jgi:hypothetical protein
MHFPAPGAEHKGICALAKRQHIGMILLGHFKQPHRQRS